MAASRSPCCCAANARSNNCLDFVVCPQQSDARRSNGSAGRITTSILDGHSTKKSGEPKLAAVSFSLSEIELEGELQYAGGIRLARSLPEGTAIYSCVRSGELHAVKGIERFGAELQPGAFAELQRELLENRG